MPMIISNATSSRKQYLDCWNPEVSDKWMHEKDPISIKENKYGTYDFASLFNNILLTEFGDVPTANLGGIRALEAPRRTLAVTEDLTYKDITWGKKVDTGKKHYIFYPIYDWHFYDVWKAIHENGWRYNYIYDMQYQYGLPLNQMRISNIHHETAVNTLFYLQEFEPHTWEKLVERMPGIDNAGKWQNEAFEAPEKLPYMFEDWREYRDFLLERIMTDDEVREKMRGKFELMDKKYGDAFHESMMKAHIKTILTNDYTFVKCKNWEAKQDVCHWAIRHGVINRG
jgi:predicted phosphoadenosine phosphosulfate sulfurtransferase